MSITLDIQYNCPQCIAKMSAAYDAVGQPVVCPQCDEQLLVPLPGDRFAVVTGTILPPVFPPSGSGPCPRCRKQFKIPSQLFGKQVRCKTCRGQFTIGRDGIPYAEQNTPKWQSLAEQLQQSPLTPGHVHAVVQLGELRDCRGTEYLCGLLFSIRRDRVRFLSASDPWVRQRLPRKVLVHVDAWCDNYRATHNKWFLDLKLDPSFQMIDERVFIADLEVTLMEALATIADPRSLTALRRKLDSVIEHRPHTADDPANPFHFKFEDAKDQKVFDLLARLTGFGKSEE